MKDLNLIRYLRSNLKFGCIRYSLINEYLSEQGNLLLSISLYPHSEFFDNDFRFIRNKVLESMEIRSMSGFKLMALSSASSKIEATYKFDYVYLC